MAVQGVRATLVAVRASIVNSDGQRNLAPTKYVVHEAYPRLELELQHFDTEWRGSELLAFECHLAA